MNDAREDGVKIEAYGTFTYPPVPCGYDRCQWVGFEVEHDPECPSTKGQDHDGAGIRNGVAERQT